MPTDWLHILRMVAGILNHWPFISVVYAIFINPSTLFLLEHFKDFYVLRLAILSRHRNTVCTLRWVDFRFFPLLILTRLQIWDSSKGQLPIFFIFFRPKRQKHARIAQIRTSSIIQIPLLPKSLNCNGARVQIFGKDCTVFSNVM